MINLDQSKSARAAKREGAGDGVTVLYGGKSFLLPVELPASVIDLLLDGELDMASLVRSAAAVWQDASTEDERRQEAGDLVIRALLEQPTLPLDVLRTVRAAIATLFGDEQWTRFTALNPSLADLAALIRGLWAEYGVGLGEAFASSGPSESGPTTSKPTSSAGTDSTPAAPGLVPATPVS